MLLPLRGFYFRGSYMYYGISQSTDLRAPDTEVKKFTSKRVALKWAEKSGYLTHGDWADEVRNHHHTFRKVFQFKGRLPKFKSEDRYTHGMYARSAESLKAIYIQENGEQIK